MIWKYLICTLWFVQQLTNGEPINEDDLYKIGFGIGDITGPAGGINMVFQFSAVQFNFNR